VQRILDTSRCNRGFVSQIGNWDFVNFGSDLAQEDWSLSKHGFNVVSTQEILCEIEKERQSLTLAFSWYF
jgi:hypothetical protein